MPQLAQQTHQLNGQNVRISGYLGSCMGYDCTLFADKNARDAWRRHVDAISRGIEPVPEEPPTIGIGGGSDFDRKAAPFQNSMVTITGTVNDRCRTPDNKPGCTDRSPDLDPTDIVPLKDK